MAACLNPDTNRSASLKVFVSGVRRIAEEMGYLDNDSHSA